MNWQIISRATEFLFKILIKSRKTELFVIVSFSVSNRQNVLNTICLISQYESKIQL